MVSVAKLNISPDKSCAIWHNRTVIGIFFLFLRMDFRKIINHIVPERFSAWLWIVLLAASWLSVADIFAYYAGHSAGWLAIAGLACFVAFKATLGTWCYDIVRGRKVLRVIVAVILAICIALSVVNGVSFYLYGMGISRKLATIVAETNRTETTEFLHGLWRNLHTIIFSYSFIGAGILAAIVRIVLNMLPVRRLWSVLAAISLPGLVYIGVFYATANWGKANHFSALRTVNCVRSVRSNLAKLKEWQKLPRVLPQPDSLASSHLAAKMVLVIGESASRGHLALYGYPLPTTPRLDTISTGLYRFDDAMAPSTATADVLPRILTLLTDIPDTGEWCDYPSTMQLLREAGYRTAWFSNQEKTGNYSNLSSLLSADADVVKYLGNIDSEDNLLGDCYDEVLLPEFRKFYNGSDSLQFVCLHLLGSHVQFNRRYPASQSHITGSMVRSALPRPWLDEARAADAAHYDNSIRYTDSILSCVIAELRADTVPAAMVYLSDHGQNVYDINEFNNRDTPSGNVPFLIYANDAYRRANPGIVADIEQALGRPFSTSVLPEVIMHLTGTTYPDILPKNDPLSPDFVERERYLNGEKNTL